MKQERKEGEEVRLEVLVRKSQLCQPTFPGLWRKGSLGQTLLVPRKLQGPEGDNPHLGPLTSWWPFPVGCLAPFHTVNPRTQRLDKHLGVGVKGSEA